MCGGGEGGSSRNYVPLLTFFNYCKCKLIFTFTHCSLMGQYDKVTVVQSTMALHHSSADMTSHRTCIPSANKGCRI